MKRKTERRVNHVEKKKKKNQEFHVFSLERGWLVDVSE